MRRIKRLKQGNSLEKNLVKNFFSGIEKFVPPPVNLIGTAGKALIAAIPKAASALGAGYNAFGEIIGDRIGEEVWGQVDEKLAKTKNEAYKTASSTLTNAKNFLLGKLEFRHFLPRH
jgi:hypothetical protein